jgi:hypothetical protein
MSTFTIQGAAEKIKGMLYGSFRAFRDVSVGGTVFADAAPVTIVLTYGIAPPRPGQIVEMGDWVIYVTGYDAATKTVSGIPDVEGTNGTLAAGTAVYIAPRFTQNDIVQAIRDEMVSWPESLFWTYETTLALTQVNGAVRVGGYGWDGPVSGTFSGPVVVGAPADGNTNLVRLLRTRALLSDGNRPSLGGASIEGWTWVSSTTFTLQMFIPDYVDSANVVLGLDYGYAAELPLATAVTNFPAGLQDIVRYGAALRLISTRDIPFTDRQFQGEPRDSEESPVGGPTQVAASLERMRTRRIMEESNKLIARWGLG